MAPVTVLTASSGTERAGLTVSSILVGEGEEGKVLALVGDLADLWAVVSESGRFVVHILASGSQALARRFAGLEPSPGGPFAGEEVEDTPWGPRLVRFDDWAGCRLQETSQIGNQRLMVGAIESVSISDLGDPLAYYRGRFRKLS